MGYSRLYQILLYLILLLAVACTEAPAASVNEMPTHTPMPTATPAVTPTPTPIAESASRDIAIKLASEWGEKKTIENQERNYRRLKDYTDFYGGSVFDKKREMFLEVFRVSEDHVLDHIFIAYADTNCVVELKVSGITKPYDNCDKYSLMIDTTTYTVKEISEEEVEGLLSPKVRALRIAKGWGQNKAVSEQSSKYDEIASSLVGSVKKKEIQLSYNLHNTLESGVFIVYVKIECAVEHKVLDRMNLYDNCGEYPLVVDTTTNSVEPVSKTEAEKRILTVTR